MDRKELLSYLLRVKNLEADKLILYIKFARELNKYHIETERLGKEIKEKKEKFIEEYKKASKLLDEQYSMNVLPEGCRNLATVWNLYIAMMSDERLSLQGVMECKSMKRKIEEGESIIKEIIACPNCAEIDDLLK